MRKEQIIRNDLSPWVVAVTDIVQGARNWPLWYLMGWQDIRQRYRRSVLGPFWLTFSMGILVLTLGMLFSYIFKTDPAEFLPFLTGGLIAWAMISTAMTEGCTAFVDSAGYIKHIRLPLSAFVYRVVWRNVIILGHNLLVYIVVAAFFRISLDWSIGLLLPGLILISSNAIWVGLLLGIISARYRDFPPIVNAMMQPVFYVTPIIWKPDLLPERFALIEFNPFFHLVELVRAPLLGATPALLSWQIALVTTVIGWVLTMVVFRRYRNRITYWL